jgi:hypothetical protein
LSTTPLFRQAPSSCLNCFPVDIAQYDTPPGIQPPFEITRRRRWDHRHDSRSLSPQASGSQDGYSRREASRGGQSEGDHLIDPLPRSSRIATQADVRRQLGQIASGSQLTLDDDAAAVRLAAVSSLPSTRPQSHATSPTPTPSPSIRYSESQSHTHGTVERHGDPKGKGRDVAPTVTGQKSLLDGEPSRRHRIAHTAAIDTQNGDLRGIQADELTRTSRPLLRKDLKSSILSHLALPTTHCDNQENSGPMGQDKDNT